MEQRVWAVYEKGYSYTPCKYRFLCSAGCCLHPNPLLTCVLLTDFLHCCTIISFQAIPNWVYDLQIQPEQRFCQALDCCLALFSLSLSRPPPPLCVSVTVAGVETGGQEPGYQLTTFRPTLHLLSSLLMRSVTFESCRNLTFSVLLLTVHAYVCCAAPDQLPLSALVSQLSSRCKLYNTYE